jgi:hypothetical protein
MFNLYHYLGVFLGHTRQEATKRSKMLGFYLASLKGFRDQENTLSVCLGVKPLIGVVYIYILIIYVKQKDRNKLGYLGLKKLFFFSVSRGLLDPKSAYPAATYIIHNAYYV